MNETQSYGDCGQQQYKRNKTVLAIPAWLVMDSQPRKKCFLLRVFPGKTPESAFTAGLPKKGASLDELAKEIGVDAKGLESTVSHFNEMVARGNDDDFSRGKSFYDQHFGDPTIKPIPILGTLEVGPFYAIQIWPGDLGTEGSLPTDEYTRVLRKNSK
ncbi:uncharacterized protein K444DRAFT_2917 [Hyaloscypha bicolor E]|jgi:FAD binding domain|uniref:FAD-dependent oxidoreductase 2 FAD-binding domain-containing protein n=1 Tax=Hyaloscypha bicolor E TaxID=1095630 RepID=A0A2J6TVA0_9HELO|nr:uncharacterized protein K444DRAFT_2917 [Hyaloscypha bicolor E]PMD66964.1 hypothetical protein K444DRAFT_2917 [Hyaloscypha bicolor E]